VSTLLHVLQHALGRDEYGRSRSKSAEPGEDYRNHYVAGEGHHSFHLCREAVAQGLMVEHAATPISGGDLWFHVTEAGKAYIAQYSPKPPTLTRGQRRYRQYLDESDCTDETFGEWLKRNAVAS